ncbi:Chromatin structure-remodeling complex subunit snf21 [Cytospora mali]|uniref:Chromatin structure-remodeling complex subunit snf21 n=1 Tax=Cytospora mali TaxID=578113 RepID=A0A194VMQ9_CYTMA|nr:Chromatin structure-remodeling complex subunit snf21 [Valsa mali]
MASVQSAAPVQFPGASLPANLTQQQVQDMVNKFREMKKNNTPPNDPEFLKTQQFLFSLQQQSHFRKQQAQLQQQQMQQKQQQQAATNGAPAGGPVGQNAPQQGALASQPPTTSLGASALPAGEAANAAAVASNASATTSQFSPAHLNLLRHQIQAFKVLSKNFGVPPSLQQSIVASRHRRQASVALQSTSPPTSQVPGSQTPSRAGANGAEPSHSEEPAPAPKEPIYKRLRAPEKYLQQTVDFFEHARRDSRLLIPGLFPQGIDFDQLRADREKIVFNRMSARYNELKTQPGNLAHWDTSKETLEVDDTLRRKAIIEMKSIALYSRQRALRDRIGRQMMCYDNLAMTTNRSMYRRLKKQSVREARITEKLEKQQRDARENREKKKHSDYLHAVFNHRNEIQASAHSQQNKMGKMGKLMYNHHFNIEKEEQKRIERNAKQRLQALKANDEEAYLKLLDQAKDTRITHLLRQTDGFLHQLASSVKAQQRAAAERYGDDAGEFLEEASDEEEEVEENNRKIDYYAVAHRVKEEVTEQANMLVGGKLKEYQIKGLQWMLSLYNNNLNGILADEMGLGKTIQTISLITYLIERKHQLGPYLVIVPLSTLTNWNLEFDKWAPTVTKVVYKGPPNTRKVQQDRIRRGEFQVLLTTYEYIIKDRNILSKIKWFHMIIDEGHRMKNSNSKLSATIQQYYSTRFRLILTGTPLQNNLSELWAMLNFTLPNIFKSAKTFDEWFNTPFANTGGQDKMELTEEEQILVIRRLHKVLRPFLLRRLKKDVEKDLPDKTEKVVKCRFSALQARLYKQMVTHQKIAVSDGKGGKSTAKGLSNMIMQLRKLCNHPFVFDEVENQMNPASISNDLLWRTAGKFELLDRILPKYQATGHRVLMFFQMTAIMDIMEDFLRLRHIQYLRLDGTTKSEERSELLHDFNRPDSPYFIFLLSTRAGGLGLNLQTADTVIIYDSDWNPHQDLQAQDRAHRIGQKNEVRILRLISSSSVEEKILERARFKLDMDGKVIQAGRFDNKSSETDRDAMLRTLLESVDLAEAGEQEEMDDEELNLILARNDNELITFQQLDDERARDPIYGTLPGCKKMPRLMAEDELPDIYLNDENPDAPEDTEVVLGRGARERTKVKYDDGLTEEQWLMAVDDDDDSPEAAAARKQAKKDKRETNRVRRMTGVNGSEGSPSGSRASTEEQETPVKKRGRKPGSKNEKRKAEDVDDEPPQKKRRGPQGRPKAIAATNGADGKMSGQQRSVLQQSLRHLYDSLMKLEVDDPDPEPDEEDKDDKDDDDEPPKRLIIGPFIKLPPKKEWADYYIVIKNPISMNQIERKIKKEDYNSLSDLRRDIELMCQNCRTFNDDGSLIHTDATTIEKYFIEECQKQLQEHPELNELEGSSPQKDTSVAPTTSASTPQPRIKLINNSASNTNGANSAARSEDGDD